VVAHRSTGTVSGLRHPRRNAAGRFRECLLGGIAPLTNVRPSFVVGRQDCPGAHEPAERCGLLSGDRVVERAGDRKPDAALVHDRGTDIHTPGNFPVAVAEHSAAGDPQLAVLPAFPAQFGPIDVAGGRATQRRSAPAAANGQPSRMWGPSGFAIQRTR